jgi:hypothetical protein
MTIYTIVSFYFENGLFGSYTSIKRARAAFEDMLNQADDILSFEDCGNYSYSFMTTDGSTFGAEIVADELDFEFNHGLITDE